MVVSPDGVTPTDSKTFHKFQARPNLTARDGTPYGSAMRTAWLWLFWCAVLGCAAPATKPPSSGPAGPSVAAPLAPTAPPGRAPSTLQKAFTGQAQPSLVVKNGLPIAQHVFIDWTERAVLAAASSQTFELLVGTHTVTCADSADPDDHPAAVTEAFETGYAYAYELHPAAESHL
jgi:hypothetical protein